MIRAILRRKWRDGHSDASGEDLRTMDFECPELESALCQGGYGPTEGYELHELVGVEILDSQHHGT